MITFSYFNFFPLSRNAVVNALNPFSLCVEDELHSCKSQQQSCTAASTHSHKWLSKPREFFSFAGFNYNNKRTVTTYNVVAITLYSRGRCDSCAACVQDTCYTRKVKKRDKYAEELIKVLLNLTLTSRSCRINYLCNSGIN